MSQASGLPFTLIELPGWEALFGDATLVFDKGSIDTTSWWRVPKSEPRPFGHGSYGDSFVIIVYRQDRAAPDASLRNQDIDRYHGRLARLFLAPNPGGSGMTLEMTGGPWTTDSQTRSAVCRILPPVYKPAAGGAAVQFQMDSGPRLDVLQELSPVRTESGEIAP